MEGNTFQNILFPDVVHFKRYTYNPNTEDLNENNLLDTQNSYYEYQIHINISDLIVGIKLHS